MSDSKSESSCPICNKSYSLSEIEQHVNKCIFLNCSDDIQKRKRSPSPTLHISHPKMGFTQKSPRSYNAIKNTEKGKSIDISFQKNKPCTSTERGNQGEINTSFSFLVPLAKQVQPKSLDEFFGQNHILGNNSVLRSLLEKEEIPNMILWGPPGCGKTSLSGVIHEVCKKNPKKFKFVSLSATSSGVKEVQNVIATAKNEMRFGKRTVLFMDEIHRFNKRQQDTFLLSVEKGEITLIGATTENPSFIINSALLSRCRVIVMEKLECNDLYLILERAARTLNIDVVDTENPCGIIKEDKG